MLTIENIILKPILSEKVSIQTEKFNRYGFLIDCSANKNHIKMAIEKLYNVKVSKVWTAVLPGKVSRYGRFSKKAPSFKKCYVEIRKGQKIEHFKGI
jgi:large subunit ribosomal protein L23